MVISIKEIGFKILNKDMENIIIIVYKVFMKDHLRMISFMELVYKHILIDLIFKVLLLCQKKMDMVSWFK